MAASVSCGTDNEDELYDETQEEGDGVITGLECMRCTDHIQYHRDVALFELVMPFVDPGGAIQYCIVQDALGEPLLPPAWLEYECFETLGEELSERLEDTPPVQEPGAALTCDYCNNSIRVRDGNERCVTIRLGELIESGRLAGSDFSQVEGPPYVACLRCARMLYELAETDGAEEILNQNGECGACTNSMCWRFGRCTCSCHRLVK